MLVNAREDTSGIAMLLVETVNRQGRMQRLLFVTVIILGLIAYEVR